MNCLNATSETLAVHGGASGILSTAGANSVKRGPRLSAADVFELVHFVNGRFFWKPRTDRWFTRRFVRKSWNTRYAGKEIAAHIKTSGYYYVEILRKKYVVHRLVWLMTYGDWPQYQIDHIDGDKTNNAVSNLRDVKPIENSQNVRRLSNNKSGVTGVHWCKFTNVWRSQITFEGRRIYLGVYKCKDAAIAARLKAQMGFGFHPNHGLDRA